MACSKETVRSSGLNFWSGEAVAGATPVVDIVAVQGLGADPFYTWTKKVPDEQSTQFWAQVWRGGNVPVRHSSGGSREVMWPRDILVPLFNNARIATYSYESDWRKSDIRTDLRECADQFLNILLQNRQYAKERQRPLVLIGHSLGSLVIQQALVNAVHQRGFTDLRLSVVGIIFLGAPFQGSDVAIWGEWLARVSFLPTSLLQTLRKGNDELHGLLTDFIGSYNDWDLVCFYEKEDQNFGGMFKAQLVSPQSASLLGKRKIFLSTDHSGLNKFSGMDDENFMLVLAELRRMVEGGASVVAERCLARDTKSSLQGNVHWMVARALNDLFTGRTELLARIKQALHIDFTYKPAKQRRFVITGLGGQGKSEVCLQVANLMREEFWGVFWVDVGNSSTAERDFITIAKTLGRPVESVPEALQVLAATKQSWLLILDNADDPYFDYQNYLPSGTHGAVIITSRIPECKRYSPHAFEALHGLESEDSRELLRKAAGNSIESWLPYERQAIEVIQLLGSHTLALIQAGAYIAQGHCQLYEYPQVFRRQRNRLMKYYSKQAKSRYRDVYTTFEASVEILEQSESEAAADALRLLEFFAMLGPSVLPLQIFQDAWNGCKEVSHSNRTETTSIDDLTQDHVLKLPSFIVVEDDEWDSHRLIEATSILTSLSLVTQHNRNGSSGISMHPLTHAWAKDRQDSKQQGAAWVAAGCTLGFSRANMHMWQTQERQLLPHIQLYLDIEVDNFYTFGSRAIVTPILIECGRILQDMRQDSRVGRLLEGMFVELGHSPKEPSEELMSLYDLHARSLDSLGRHREAVELLEQVVKIKGMTLAEDHLDRLASQHELASAYEANGQVEEAVELLEQVVKIQGITLAEDHPSRLASQHALAIAYEANGQVEEAVELLEQVVKIQGITLAEDHPSRLASQHALAIAYEANGQVEEAVELLEQVAKIQGITLAEDHPSRLASQHALASAYKANGQVEEAVELLGQVVKIEGMTLAEDHPSRLASQHALASAYEANGQVEEAVELLEQVVKIQGMTLAEDHPDRLASQHELAIAYEANGQVEEAVELLEHVVKIQGMTLAEDHPSRLASQHALAIAYEANGQVEEAVELLEQVAKIKGITLAEDHPSRLASQHALAIAYEANGQVEEAVELLGQVVKIQGMTLAEDHPSRLASQHELAIAYEANRQVEEAVELLEHVVKIKGMTLAEDHPSRLASQHALAIAYEVNGQVSEAIELLEHVIKIKRFKFREGHPSLIVSEDALVYFLS